ncbi:hypothetical protein ZIOFF_012661 [Zingiber officinale]|uniref:BED-type domain-containing protein n=1 Tax=Zingiber officinale TaxID=94328 RepID=A0A8J5HPP3_ZINOF|nr:hypothetical protein ZIOFF_012661 [Zingiber officinale]
MFASIFVAYRCSQKSAIAPLLAEPSSSSPLLAEAQRRQRSLLNRSPASPPLLAEARRRLLNNNPRSSPALLAEACRCSQQPGVACALCSTEAQRRRRCSQKPGVACSIATLTEASSSPALLAEACRCSQQPAVARNSPPSLPVAALFLEDVDDSSPLWKFVTKVEKAIGGENVTWSCNICSKVCKGSYSRVKTHLLKQKGAGIAGCMAITMDQMKRMQQLIDDTELRKKNSKQKEVPLPSSSASSNMASKFSFCSSGFLQNDDQTKKRKGPLGPLEKSFNLNARDELHPEIQRLFYTGDYLSILLGILIMFVLSVWLLNEQFQGPHGGDSKFYEVVHNILVERWNKNNTPLHCLTHSLNSRYYSHE